VHELKTIMENDENTFLLTGDLGFSVFENIKDSFSKQYINMGVAEQKYDRCGFRNGAYRKTSICLFHNSLTVTSL
jgi:Transketolase, pyrimidine binding domain.